MSADNSVPTALSIAGSDPSGGAGIQADLKTFSRLRVYGMAVVAAMTAQNTLGVSGVSEVPAEFVGEQLESVLADIMPAATKTGMLLTPAVIEVVADKLKQYAARNVVVDPVMIATSGAQLMTPEAIAVFRRALLPLAFLVTPNIDEAGTLTDSKIQTLADMERAARQIEELGSTNVLVKGGHLQGDEAVDVLFADRQIYQFRSERIVSRHTHGTGCVLSASIAAYLACGESLYRAVELGKEFVTHAIRNGLQIGKGMGPCDPLSLGG